MRTLDEVMKIMKSYMVPEEIVEAIDIRSDELVNHISDYISENLEQIESNLIILGIVDEEEDE